MIDTFKCENHKDIINYSKLVWSEGMMPARIVLCKIPSSSLGQDKHEYVTYRENLVLDGNVWKHRDFYWGHYFGDNEKKAVEDFNERADKL